MKKDAEAIWSKLMDVRKAVRDYHQNHPMPCECDDEWECTACALWQLLELPTHTGPRPRRGQ